MESTTIRISKPNREKLKAIDKVPDRAIEQLLGQQNAVFTNVIEKVANKIVDEIETRTRTIVREELERMRG